jgi:hypothetical protein
MTVNGNEPGDKLLIQESLSRLAETLKAHELDTVCVVINFADGAVEVVNIGDTDSVRQLGLLSIAKHVVTEEMLEDGDGDTPPDERAPAGEGPAH